jgi:hypothetical protein
MIAGIAWQRQYDFAHNVLPFVKWDIQLGKRRRSWKRGTKQIDVFGCWRLLCLYTGLRMVRAIPLSRCDWFCRVLQRAELM